MYSGVGVSFTCPTPMLPVAFDFWDGEKKKEAMLLEPPTRSRSAAEPPSINIGYLLMKVKTD